MARSKRSVARLRRKKLKRYFIASKSVVYLTGNEEPNTNESTPTISEIISPREDKSKRAIGAGKIGRLHRQRAVKRLKKRFKQNKKNIITQGVSDSKMVETKDLVLKLLGDKSNEKGELSHSYEYDANLLQDLDLVILAAPLDDYKVYANLLRQEYASMTEDSYKLMRLKVLETLLIIPKIYSTPEYQTKFEEAARDNIKWEISELKA